MRDFREVVHEMRWFYGEGTRSEEGREVERERGERERGKSCAGGKGEECGFEGKDF